MTSAGVVVLGGGAAGLFCAITAGRRGRKVVVLEHMSEPGRKILISGGGRCNFTNLEVSAGNFLSGNPHFSKSALARFSPSDFISLVDKHGIPWHEKSRGQLFCDRTASEIRDLLVSECRSAGVEILTRTNINAVSKSPGGHFEVRTGIGDFSCESLVVATGGLSFPRLGASDLGYRIARQFGLEVVGPRPALVPFVWKEPDLARFGGLAGVSCEASVKTDGHEFTEGVLFTHRGLSGPAVLQISSYWEEGVRVQVDLLPGRNLETWLKEERDSGSRLLVRSALQNFWPKRIVESFADSRLLDRPLQNLPDAEARELSIRFQKWEFVPAGTEGYAKAEVTRGGVSTDELSSKTLEAKGVKGLFFAGEVIDVTGWLGGFNFQWAWASGHAAGEAA